MFIVPQQVIHCGQQNRFCSFRQLQQADVHNRTDAGRSASIVRRSCQAGLCGSGKANPPHTLYDALQVVASLASSPLKFNKLAAVP